MDQNGETGRTFSKLPEGCIADVLARTTPEDACRLALVSKGFHSAADSDGVWEKLLPPDYREIIARSINPLSVPHFSRTKDLYLYLSDHPLIIDGGDKCFQLLKRSGKISYILAPSTLRIDCAHRAQDLRWTTMAHARFEEVAQLRQVWWLEIHGKINTCSLSPDTNYAAYLVYNLVPSALGFNFAEYYSLHAQVSVGLFAEGCDIHYAILDQARDPASSIQRAKEAIFGDIRYPNERTDGWLEIELGNFFTKRGENKEVNMSLMEVRPPNFNRDLIVAGISIRPKEGN